MSHPERRPGGQRVSAACRLIFTRFVQLNVRWLGVEKSMRWKQKLYFNGFAFSRRSIAHLRVPPINIMRWEETTQRENAKFFWGAHLFAKKRKYTYNLLSYSQGLFYDCTLIPILFYDIVGLNYRHIFVHGLSRPIFLCWVLKDVHYIAKSIGSPPSYDGFDYFSNVHEYKS